MKIFIKALLIVGISIFAQSVFAQSALQNLTAPAPASAPAPAVTAPAPTTASSVYTPVTTTTSTAAPSAPTTTAAPKVYTSTAVINNTATAPATGSVISPTAKPVESLSTIKPVVQKTSSIDPLSSLNAPGATKASGSINTGADNALNGFVEPNITQLQQLAVNTKTASSALTNALGKLVSARNKIAARISSAKNKGAQVNDLQTKLADSDSKLADSKLLIDNLSIVPVSKGDLGTIIATIQAEDNLVRSSIRISQDSLRDLLSSLATIESTLKK